MAAGKTITEKLSLIFIKTKTNFASSALPVYWCMCSVVYSTKCYVIHSILSIFALYKVSDFFWWTILGAAIWLLLITSYPLL